MATSVNTVTAFLAALLDVSVAEIVLTGNIDFKEYGMITETINIPGRDLIIDLNNKTISNIYPAIDISAFYMTSGKVEIKNGFITNLMHNECTFLKGISNSTEIAFNNVGFSSVSAGSTSKSMLSALKGVKFSNCSMYRKWRNIYKINETMGTSGVVYESCTVSEDNSTYKNTLSSVRNSTYNYCLFNGVATSYLTGTTSGTSVSRFPYGQCNNCCVDGAFTGAFAKGSTTYINAVRNDSVQSDGVTPCIFDATFVTPQNLESADDLLDIGLLAVQGV